MTGAEIESPGQDRCPSYGHDREQEACEAENTAAEVETALDPTRGPAQHSSNKTCGDEGLIQYTQHLQCVVENTTDRIASCDLEGVLAQIGQMDERFACQDAEPADLFSCITPSAPACERGSPGFFIA